MDENNTSLQPKFSNQVIDKSQLKELIVWAFRNYGIARAANMADRLKDLGFYYATKAGISLSLEDLRIPPAKKPLLERTINLITSTDHKYYRGEITAVERFQKVIDTWNNASDSLKKEVIRYFKDTDPLNSIYMIAFSGARGNISQVRQLVGMRGLMSDPQGQIIDLPISSNFREGLTVTDYFISSYGARKGLVDTALRTADSGYLTRRLVDVSQDVIIRELDCKTRRGILLEDMIENQKYLIPLQLSLVGRTLADDLYDVKTNELIARANQSINPTLANYIIQANINKVLVRSPITCNSVGSVCQLCYGWNLAHGQLVDLGEAVGIIAAQSIGEPGTQLTMRTFHTGGVFTGELAQCIYASISGYLEYDLQGKYTIIRTRHGELAFLMTANHTILLKSSDGQQQDLININKGTILFEKNNTFVEQGHIIAEYPLSNRLITERAQKSILADFSGKVQFTNLTVEEMQSKQNTIRIAKDGGLVWILSGKTYRVPDHAKLLISAGQTIDEETVLASIEITSKYNGKIELLCNDQDLGLSSQEIKVVLDSKLLPNSRVYFDRDLSNSSYILELSNYDKFLLYIQPNDILQDGQIIGELISDTYITQTGGIVKYLDLPVTKSKANNSHLKEKYDILGSGYILWISEETHEINKDISLLFVHDSDFIEAGTEIIKNIFAQNSGIVEIIEKDGIVLEVVIKPGDIYMITENSINTSKTRGFLRPGEVVVEGITTNKLVYWESIHSNSNNYLLIRPVIVYSVPQKTYILDSTTQQSDHLKLEVIQKTAFKDGDRVKSVQGVNLIKTYLSIMIDNTDNLLDCNVKFEDDTHDKNIFYLRFIIAETLFLRNDKLYKSEDLDCHTTLLVKDSEEVQKHSVIARTNIISKVQGIVEHIDSSSEYNQRLLIVTKSDEKIFHTHGSNIKVNINDWIYAGDQIADGIYCTESGQIINITESQVAMRIGRPYLISPSTILHVNHSNLVERGENIATLIFERPKTGDIVQGLPRIEEILEARKKSDTSFNPHILLEESFASYLKLGLNLYNATILSIQEIQLFLVKEVQLVYQSQGVDISDKHIEVIVRQMTSKVKIELGGDTECLPGEMIELQKIHAINHTMNLMNKQEATYYPILLGITKASLNTDSFISAASFQETTKVLTEAAISGKLDWLKGLKENVIIGRLIPAGTGFNIYNKSATLDTQLLNKNIDTLHVIQAKQKKTNTISEIDDIILDDRSARDYHMPSN
uniref:DNA-directed RNA polymerase subunit beta'' n=1 Tax=Hommersandiophycus borowitzkae TaxID=268573 RepID=A0A1G4NTZ0_9FLOR|nr:RNA polymerase beta-subunit [Hommersandiophycus borowitzkae]SCW22163.1 RNA polymerase beta-subunit [Hommersandiophycus borowitzkae]